MVLDIHPQMKHFQKTNHPVMIALPTKSWKWCYVDKTYI